MWEILLFFVGLNKFNSNNSCSRYGQEFLVEKPQLRIISFYNYKHGYLIHTLLDKALKGNFFNQALLSLHEGSLKGSDRLCKVVELSMQSCGQIL